MIQVGRTTATVFLWGDDQVGERMREISILLVEAIEPLPQATISDQSENASN